MNSYHFDTYSQAWGFCHKKKRASIRFDNGLYWVDVFYA